MIRRFPISVRALIPISTWILIRLPRELTSIYQSHSKSPDTYYEKYNKQLSFYSGQRRGYFMPEGLWEPERTYGRKFSDRSDCRQSEQPGNGNRVWYAQ